jgi:signal transduction histidine kinase/ABC-type amino acid transport substrate-binding protein
MHSLLKTLLALLIISLCSGVYAKRQTHFDVGVNKSFPPYEFEDESGHIKGANIDLLKAISKDTGLGFDFTSDDWSTVRENLDKGDLQMIAGIIKTPQLADKYLFSEPHNYIHYSLFIRRDNQNISSCKDLVGKGVIVEAGDVIEGMLKSLCPGAKVIYTSDYQDALEKLSCGTAMAVVMPRIHGYILIAKLHLDNLMEASTLGDALPYCIALPLGQEQALKEINQSLSKLTGSYEYRQSQNKWFGVSAGESDNFDTQYKIYRIVLVLLILGLVIICFFIIKLINRIRSQQKYLKLQNAERYNYEKEFNQRHQLFVSGPIVFLKWSDTKREMFDSISDNFSKYGYDTNDVLTGKILYRSIIHPDDLEWILHSRQYHIDKREYSYYQIYRIICPVRIIDDPACDVVNIWHERNTALAQVNTVQIRWIYDYTVIIPDEIANTFHFYGYLLDITQHKAFEHDIMKQHQDAQVAITTKDIFLTSISIEINTPVNALIGLARKVVDKGLDADQKSYVQTIVDSAWRLKQILQQIHDFLSILKGSIGSVPQWYILKRLMEPVISDYQIMIASKKLGFEHNVYQPTALVYLDADWFQKILRIIMDNAIKFTSEGKIELQADLKQITPDKGELIVKIIDTGIGIPQDKINLILEPFTQADESYTRRYGGIGLGLSIARNLLIQMNGVMNITSIPDHGTSVEIHFPVSTQ